MFTHLATGGHTIEGIDGTTSKSIATSNATEVLPVDDLQIYVQLCILGRRDRSPLLESISSLLLKNVAQSQYIESRYSLGNEIRRYTPRDLLAPLHRM